MILAAVTATTVDLSPILSPLIQIAGLILTGVAGWATLKVAQFAHVSRQSAALQTVIAGVDRAISYATSVALQKADASDKVAIQNATQAEAVNYVATKLPGMLKAVGVDVATADGRQKIADLVLARLPPFTPPQ